MHSYESISNVFSWPWIKRNHWNSCTDRSLQFLKTSVWHRISFKTGHRSYPCRDYMCGVNNVLFLMPSMRRLYSRWIFRNSLQHARRILCFMLKAFLTKPQVGRGDSRNMLARWILCFPCDARAVHRHPLYAACGTHHRFKDPLPQGFTARTWCLAFNSL